MNGWQIVANGFDTVRTKVFLNAMRSDARFKVSAIPGGCYEVSLVVRNVSR